MASGSTVSILAPGAGHRQLAARLTGGLFVRRQLVVDFPDGALEAVDLAGELGQPSLERRDLSLERGHTRLQIGRPSLLGSLELREDFRRELSNARVVHGRLLREADLVHDTYDRRVHRRAVSTAGAAR